MAFVTAISPAEPASLADTLGREISQLCSYLYAAEAKVLALVHRFDSSECYAQLGFHSTAHWINYQCGVGMNAARERVRVANALPKLPKICAAFAAGTLSYSKVRAITRIADESNEDYLLMIGTFGTAHHVEKLVARYRSAVREQDESRADAVHAGRELSIRFDDDGAMILNGRFPPEQGVIILKAVEMATEQAFVDAAASDREMADAPAETSAREPIGMRRADALANLAETFLNHPDNAGNTAERYQVMVHVAAETLTGGAHCPAETPVGIACSEVTTRIEGRNPSAVTRVGDPPAVTSVGLARSEVTTRIEDRDPSAVTPVDDAPAVTPHLENGPQITVETSRRIACDCSLVPIRENVFGEPLAIGRRTRSIPPAIRRALQSRDGGCRFPGCTHTKFVDGHHIVHWADGGETSLANLVLLCRQHHRLVHEGSFRCEIAETGDIRFADCRGKPISSGQLLPGVTEDLDAWLDTQFFEHKINHDSCRAKHGADERMDWHLAVAALF